MVPYLILFVRQGYCTSSPRKKQKKKKTLITALRAGPAPPLMASEPVPRPKNRLVTIPSPLRTLFAAFPLVTLPPGQLPARCPDEESRRRNVLYVFSSPDAALNGLPSYNPTCLKWQTFLKLAGVEFDTVGGNNHASPTGVLPFLLPAVSAAASSAGTIKEAGPKRGGGCASIPLHHRKVLPLAAAKLEGFAFRHPQARTRIRDSSKVLRAEVYQSLLDTSMRNAWVGLERKSAVH